MEKCLNFIRESVKAFYNKEIEFFINSNKLFVENEANNSYEIIRDYSDN